MGSFFSIFLYFLKMKKVPERLFQYFGHTLKTQYQSFESFFLILFRLVKLFIVKKRPNGVSFKLFSDSLNMKRLSNSCLLHTHKSIWRFISPMVGYLFFDSNGLSMKKEHSIQSWLEEVSKVLFYTFMGLRDKIIRKRTLWSFL